MQVFAQLSFLLATIVVGASAAAVEPRATTAPLEKRQTDLGGVESIFDSNTALAQNPVYQSFRDHFLNNPELTSAVEKGGAASLSYFAGPASDPTLSQAVYSALGTSSADALYSAYKQAVTSAESSLKSSPTGSSGSNAATAAMQAPLAAVLSLIGATAFVLALI